MPADIETQLRELRHSIDLLQDRVMSLEADHNRLTRKVGRIPLKIPTRRTTKVALSVSAGLVVMALLFAFSPKDIKVNSWRYQSDGVSAEAIAAVASAIGLYFTLLSHWKDKNDYRGNDDQPLQ